MSRNILHDNLLTFTEPIGYCAYHDKEMTKDDVSRKHCRHKLNSRKPCTHLSLYNFKPKPEYRNDRCGVKLR